MSDTKLVPLKDLHPEKQMEPPKPTEMAQVEAAAISKFAQASMMELTEHEKAILFAPIDVRDILTRPVGGGKVELYLEWAWYAQRLDDAFGPGDWAITPAPWNPKIAVRGNTVIGEYILWIRGRYVRRAYGVHEETRANANFGDAAEATEAEALKRCCKKLGMARDLWRKSKIEEFKVQMTKRNSTPSVRHEAQPSPVAPVTDPIFIECKDMIERASTLDELKAAWDYYNRVKDSLSAAARTRLFEQKNQRKTAIEEQS